MMTESGGGTDPAADINMASYTSNRRESLACGIVERGEAIKIDIKAHERRRPSIMRKFA